MLSGVSIFCFAASYAIALVLEVTRLLFRSGIRGAVMLGFAGAGLFAHTVYLFYRVIESYQASGLVGAPLSSTQEFVQTHLPPRNVVQPSQDRRQLDLPKQNEFAQLQGIKEGHQVLKFSGELSLTFHLAARYYFRVS